MQRFRTLVDTHRDRVFSLACYLLNDRVAAEDVTQEVLLRMWQNRATLDYGRIGSWLTRVTRNACIDVHRRRAVVNRAMDVNTEGLQYQLAETDQVAPDEALEALEFQEQLRQAISELPEPHRSIVVSREINEMKYDEIAEALELPLNTVKVYLHRARKMLRDKLRNRLDYVSG